MENLSSDIRLQICFETLLNHGENAGGDCLDALERGGIILGGDGFLVAVSEANLSGGALDALAGVKRLIDEKLKGKRVAYSQIISGRVVTVFCAFRAVPEAKENDEFCRWAANTFLELAGTKDIDGFRCGISGMCFGTDALPAAYDEALDELAAFSYLNDIKTPVLSVLTQREQAEIMPRLSMYNSAIRRIRRGLQSGDTQRCVKTTIDAVRLLLYQNPIAMGSITLRINTFFSILNSVLIYEEGLDAEAIRANGILMEIQKSKNEQELYAAIEGFMALAVKLKRHVEMPWPERLTQIKQYVDQNTSDPALSLTAIAEEFSQHPSTLSSRFKSWQGQGLWEYIQRRRVDMAKELLRATTLSIFEVSRQVGFGSMVSMHRAFKKYENAAPGEFRGGGR